MRMTGLRAWVDFIEESSPRLKLWQGGEWVIFLRSSFFEWERGDGESFGEGASLYLLRIGRGVLSKGLTCPRLEMFL